MNLRLNEAANPQRQQRRLNKDIPDGDSCKNNMYPVSVTKLPSTKHIKNTCNRILSM